jgi:translation elongation factor P/translation initiation factor 5A
MIDVNDLRKGVTFEFDGVLFKVLEYSHKQGAVMPPSV